MKQVIRISLHAHRRKTGVSFYISCFINIYVLKINVEFKAAQIMKIKGTALLLKVELNGPF